MDNAQALARLAELRKQLTDIRPIEERAKTTIPFFDWNISFSDVFSQGGFDIVIGNPPYFKYEGSHKGELENLKKLPELKIAYGGKLNAYKLFLAKAINILARKDGIISYIFQNSYLADLQAANLRKASIDDNQIIVIDSFPERDNKKKRVFESVKMSVCVAILKKTKSFKPFKVNFWDDKNKSTGTQTQFTRDNIRAIDKEGYTIPRIKTDDIELVIKLKSCKTLPLKCFEGELNMTFHKPYFTGDENSPKILKGASIQKYFYTEQMSQGEIEYLDEAKYLADNGGEKSKHHEFARIAMQGMTGANDRLRIVMAYVPEGFYLANSCNYLIPNDEYPAFYLLGLMNSKLINWFFRRFSTNSNVNGYEVEAFPVPIASGDDKEKIAKLTEEIVVAKQKNRYADTSDLESKIDELVYDLYKLEETEKNKIRNS